MTVDDALHAVGKALGWVVLCVLLVVALLVGLRAAQPLEYSSDITLSVQPPSGDAGVSASFLQFVVPAVQERADSESLRDQVASAVLGRGADGSEFELETTVTPNSGLVRVTVRSTEREVVLPLLSEYAEALVRYPRQAALPIEVRLLQPALAPAPADRTQQLLLSAAQGLVLGLLLGLAVALLLARRRRRADVPGHVGAQHGVPVLRAPDDPEEVAELDDLLEVAAGVLSRRLSGRVGQVAVLPADPLSGRSRAGLGLARALALLGSRVVLVEADLTADGLRAPELVVGPAQSGTTRPSPTPVPHLDYLPGDALLRTGAGRGGSSRAALVAAALPALPQLLPGPDGLLVLDCPPAGTGPEVDALLLHAQEVLLVVRDGRRRGLEPLLQASLARLAEAGVRCCGLLVLQGASGRRPSGPSAAERDVEEPGAGQVVTRGTRP